MKTRFIGREYVALSLLSAKKEILNENFITTFELNKFCNFLHQEFDNRYLNVVITSNKIDNQSFIVNEEFIKKTENCIYTLDTLPSDILNVLSNTVLIANFLIDIEQQKIKNLEKISKKVLIKRI